jgi:hypothetical protein
MLAPGMRIGMYEVTAPLGSGGMGEVYRARDARLKRDVAVKILRADAAHDAGRIARLRREAELLASLNHPNIAHVYGLEESDDTTALVMELVEGEDLSRRIARGAIPIREALRIAEQVASALDAAHEHGIVHRDLKPANIKLRPDGTAKVLDFGLAKPFAVAPWSESDVPPTVVESHATQPGIVVGTVAYMSPEQARGQPVDRRTDIWSFGCVLYEMLTGRPMFARGTVSDTIAAVLHADIDLDALPLHVPDGTRQLVSRCLERSTKDRLRDIADARLYLETTSPSGTTAHILPAARRVSRRTLITGGAALGLIGAAAAGAVVARRDTAPATLTFRRLTFRRGLIRTARFGPDFKTVVYGALWDGDVCRVYSVRAESPESAALAFPPAAPLAVSASGELALSLGTHFRGIMPYGTLARVPMAGGAPRELQEQVKYADWSPDGQDLAIVRSTGRREQLEFPAGQVLAEPQAAGGGFSFPRVSPRGDAVAAFELIASQALWGHVAVFDRSGQRRATSAVRYFNVFGLAWKGDEVWFTAAEELPLFRNAVYAMDLSGAVRIVTRVPGNTSLHDIAPDGRAIIARTDDRSGIAVRRPGATTERDLSWLDASTIADMSTDGHRVLFSEYGVGGGPRGSTYLRGTDGSLAVRLGDGMALSLSRDQRWALSRTASTHLDVIPTGPGHTRRIERAGLKISGGRWLPDGQRVMVRAAPDGAPQRLYVLDVEGGGSRPVTPEGFTVTSAWSLSPDGAMVAVSNGERLELFPIGDGSPRRIPGASDRWQVVGWTTGGLLVSEDPAGSGLVLRVDPDTGRRDTWADIAPQDPVGIMNQDLSQLAVTPDGRGYGYGWHRALSDLYLVDGWS